MPRKTDGEKIDDLVKQVATLEERLKYTSDLVTNLEKDAEKLDQKHGKDLEKLDQKLDKSVEKLEQKMEKGRDRIWDLVKIVITAIVTAVITIFLSRNLGSH